jgi:sigma-E factor negative regulatory protein RseA
MSDGTEDGNMTRRQEELSALVDGELPTHEADQLLAALAAEPELRDSWSRYQLIGTAIRRGVPEVYDPDLAGRVATAVADVEPEAGAGPGLPPRVAPATSRLRRSVSGFAMAASVAVVALLGVRYLDTPDPEAGAVRVATLAPLPVQAQTVATASPGQDAVPLDEQRLNDYLQRHNELALGGGLRTLPPYVRVVSASTTTVSR